MKKVLRWAGNGFITFNRINFISSVLRHREAASFDAKAAEMFTIFFLKKVPKRTYITEEENSISSLKSMRLVSHSLVLCKCKRGFQSQTSACVFCWESTSLQEIQGSEKPVKCFAEVQQQSLDHSFLEWLNKVFGPALTKYLLENNLALKISICNKKIMISVITQIILKLWNTFIK